MMDKEQCHQDTLSDYSDEIDIFRLCADFWERRILIIVCMLLVTLCGLAYSYSATERFEAEVHIYPTYDPGLYKSSLLAKNPIEDNFSEDVFKLVQKNLASQSTFMEVVSDPSSASIIGKKLPTLSDVEKAKTLSRKVKVIPPSLKKQQTEFITVKLEWSDSIDAVKLANAWVAFAIEGVKSELIEVSQSSLNREIKEIDQRIAVIEERAKNQINREISRLKEAKTVVNQIDALNVTGSDSLLSVMPEYANVRSLRALYQVGGKVLDAEITALESRKGRADYYIEGLFKLEERKAELMSIPLGAGFISPASAEILPIDAGRRLGPNCKLIVGLSLLFGFMIGIVLALIKTGFDNRVLAK